MIVSGLEHDSSIELPHFTILKASAGSGKTHALTKRFVQFLLSDSIRNNQLRNIMAITFSNNAAQEMKTRILEWLKKAYFGDPATLRQLQEVVSLPEEEIRRKAGLLIDTLLDHYTDFQVKTIDSFMASVFKASVVDLGYSPDFEILMGNDSLLEYAFSLFLRKVREGTPEGDLLEEVVALIQEARGSERPYLWDPTASLLEEVKTLYRKLSSLDRKILLNDCGPELAEARRHITESMGELEGLVRESRLEQNAKSTYPKICRAVRAGAFTDLIGMGIKTVPVKKPKPKETALLSLFEEISEKWHELGGNINQYKYFHAFSYYTPYLRVYESFREMMERTKRQLGKVLIEDIGKELSTYLESGIVPDVYCRIGETVYHYKIDEFQDTSPIQWRTLQPLIENSLAQGGSLFAVGDTKQAIYRFRNAEYRIMRGFERESPFPSARHHVRELETNHRSGKSILALTDKVFKEIVPRTEKYGMAAALSGLDCFVQQPSKAREGEGAVEVRILEADDTHPPELDSIVEILADLVERGYRYRDIAILAPRNSDVVAITVWLNERSIPVVSYSSLDVRTRKVTGEVVALLNFLDSPIDNLSFATFLTGGIFREVLDREHPHVTPASLQDFLFTNRGEDSLYKAFQKTYPDVWDSCFAALFKAVGYLPLYDLVSDIYKTFRVFEHCQEEEAAFAKILEVIKNFEESGTNSLRDFLSFASEEEAAAEWNLDIPRTLNAVQVMTVHKAKGLGFPAVIVVLYGARNKPLKYVLHESGDGVSLLKLSRDLAECDEGLKALYEAEQADELVSKLNSLYVGLTRAEQEMHILGVKGKNEEFPLDIFSQVPPLSGAGKPAAGERKTDKGTLAGLWHHTAALRLPVRADALAGIEGRRRGEFYHQVLSCLEYADEQTGEILRDSIERVKRERGEDYPTEEILQTVSSFLENGEISRFFRKKPDRQVYREQCFTDGEGNLFRMDRVVIDPGQVSVLDFKTGEDKGLEDKYRAQLSTYLRILRGIYPGREVRGLIAYIDLNEVREVQ